MKLVRLFSLIFFLLFSSGFGQEIHEGAGTTSNLFLRSDLSPRVSGLSGAYTAIANDENTLLYNTAGLATLRIAGVAFNHTQWFEDIRMENLLFAYKLSSKLGMGIGISYMGMPAIQGMDANGNPTEKIDVNSSIFQLGFGYRIGSGVNAGLGIKYFSDQLAGYLANGVAFDFGYYMDTVVRGLSFGLAVQNIGGTIKYDAASEKIPLTIRGGAAYKIPRQDLRFALDVAKPSDQNLQVSLGIEYVLAKYITFRLGNQAISGKMLTPAFGLGLNISDRYLVDYTFASKENLGATHRAGITLRFNLKPLFREKRLLSTGFSGKLIKAPTGLKYRFEEQKMILEWSDVPGAQYNVYAKAVKAGQWIKITPEPLTDTHMEYKRPSAKTRLYLTVTAILNGIESSIENELEVGGE